MLDGIDFIPDMPNGKGKGCMIVLWIIITIVIIAMHISSFN
jgi:hypothetical protein